MSCAYTNVHTLHAVVRKDDMLLVETLTSSLVLGEIMCEA